MDQLNVALFSPPSSTSGVMFVPYLWLLFKTYFEENATANTKRSWNWIEPFDDAEDEEVIEILSHTPPTVFCVSCYIWNERKCHKIAARVKQLWPSCVVVLGGPQQNTTYSYTFFRDYPYIDVVCRTDGYGEVFVLEMLEQITTNKLDFSKLPFALYSDNDRGLVRSSVPFSVKSFAWQQRLFSSNADTLLRLKRKAERENVPVYTTYETSRGCPYSCTFCEWGGGSGKVSFKPTQYVYEDIQALSEYKINTIDFADANFGIIERDVDVIKKLIEERKKTGFPQNVEFDGFSKNKKTYVNQIIDMLAEQDILDEIKISVQDFDFTTLRNVNRVDKSWQEQLHAAKIIREKTNVSARFETILGLPGSTIDSFYKSFDIEYQEGVHVSRYLWYMLDDAPANDPVYKQIHQIRVASITTQKGIVGDREYSCVNLSTFSELQTHNVVVETSSYSITEWVEMFILTTIKEAGQATNILNPILRYEAKKGTKVGRMLQNCYRSVFFDDNTFFGRWMLALRSHVETVISNGGILDFIPINDSLALNIKSYVVAGWLLFYREFFDSMKVQLTQHLGHDPMRDSLIDFVANFLKTCEYNPLEGKQVKTDYSWYEWITEQSAEFYLYPQPTTLYVKDTKHGPYGNQIDWHLLPVNQQSFFTLTTLSYVTYTHLFENVEIVHE